MMSLCVVGPNEQDLTTKASILTALETASIHPTEGFYAILNNLENMDLTTVEGMPNLTMFDATVGTLRDLQFSQRKHSYGDICDRIVATRCHLHSFETCLRTILTLPGFPTERMIFFATKGITNPQGDPLIIFFAKNSQGEYWIGTHDGRPEAEHPLNREFSSIDRYLGV